VLGDQWVALLFGATLLAVFQSAKFAELDITDPVTSRYVSLLPGAKAKDFASRSTYYVTLVFFLLVSLILYYLVCLISPQVLSGAIKQFTNTSPQFEGIAFPLYVAALFMGLTQPVLPGLIKLEDALRTFFHDQIEVPRRVIDLSESLIAAIDARSGSDRRELTKEVKNLIDDSWLQRLKSDGDLPFYKMQLERLELGDPTTAAKTLKDSSPKELREFIEKLVLFNLIAVMRRSGPQRLSQVAAWSQTTLSVPPSNIGHFVSTLILSGLVFGFTILAIWYILYLLGHEVESYFNFPPNKALWPNEQWLGVALAQIVPAIFVALLISVYMLPKTIPGSASGRGVAKKSGITIDFLVEFAHSTVSIIAFCFVTSLAINVIAQFYQYGISTTFKDVTSLGKFMVIFATTFPSVALSYCALLYLSRERAGQPLSFGFMSIVVAIVISALALLVALLFLHLDFLPAFPDIATVNSGWDYVIFYVVANVLVSECAFASVILFFHVQTQRPMP
jgi:hypothetical protein